MTKDPPDKCKTLKCNLKTVLRSNYDYEFLFSAIKKVNDLTFLCSHFIRSFIIYKFEKGDNIPEISKQFIKNAFKVLSQKSCGPKTKNSKGIMDDMENYFNGHFVNLTTESFLEYEDINEYKLLAKNTSYMTALEEDSMLISYENNIKINFEKYLRQFVNQNFKDTHQKLIDKSKDKVLLRKELKSELRYVKQDLIKGTKESNIKYRSWIKDVKDKIIPTLKHDLETDLDKYPQKFIKCMLFMNKYLEDNGLKLFQPISLRTDVKDKYVTFNTNALVDILPTLKNKNDYYKRITECQSDLWNQVFNINTKKLKLKGYSFNYQIQTDGVGLSINFIKDDEVEIKKKKIKMMTERSKKAKTLYKDLSENEKSKLKEMKNEKDIEISLNHKEKLKEIQKGKRKEFKKLPKNKQDEIKLKLKLDRDEFNYIEDLVKIDDFLTLLKKYKKDNMIGYADPGKRSPLTIMREDGKFYEYRTKRRLKETKRLKYNNLIDNKKFKTILNNKSIKEIEVELSEYSHKSVNSKKFNEYVKKKVSFKNLVKDEETYNNYLKKLNWYMFINSKRHEDKIINEIETFIGKKGTIVIGDWGGKGNISYISTPNIGLQRRLKEKLNVYHVNEFKTSQLHHKTKDKMNNLKLNVTYKSKRQEKEIKKSIKLHSVLTFKTGHGSYGCINRDKNAVKNMKYIVEELIKTQKRPQQFTINSKTCKNRENLEKHEDLKIKKEPQKITKKEKQKVIVKVIKIRSKCSYGILL